ncbi:MAG: MoxR family ATPase [Oscillospiraceae bacterium]|nr:MoxR family ATPase [Oscillospiraceae bacterium]MDD4368698.1 MoxR family ATPase [Oscillospiraceae bacterium]
MDTHDTQTLSVQISEDFRPLVQQLEQVIMGKQAVILDLLTALLAGGHVLLEDVPGTGKTSLAKALAQSLELSFQRIQFTPDLLPSEISGINVFNQKSGEFVFRQGAVFSQIVLADEINRATPRTQSSLLEAMEEHQVSVDGQTYPLPDPFMVIATQNPVETLGTFPLPEAQLDRFLMRLSMGYPDRAAETRMLESYGNGQPQQNLRPCLSASQVLDWQSKAAAMPVGQAVRDYILDLVRQTREDEDRLLLGLSPRAALALQRAAKARACLCGQAFVTPDHVQAVAVQVLSHRLLLRQHQLNAGPASQRQRIEELLTATQVPTEAYKQQAAAAAIPGGI